LWKHSQLGNELVPWRPFGSSSRAGVTVGFCPLAGWVAEQKGQLKPLEKTQDHTLLTVLELGDAALMQIVDEAAVRSTSPPNALRALMTRPVCAGLRSNSEYWQKLALHWAPKLPIDEELRRELEAVEVSGYSQQSRHEARRILHGRGK
jgi:hypothetical protein